MKQENIIANIKKCPHYSTCHKNFCPLDWELSLRNGGKEDKCRWMREPKVKKIEGREFMAGGSVMPDDPLNFVPECNTKWLNTASQKRWHEINKNNKN